MMKHHLSIALTASALFATLGSHPVSAQTVPGCQIRRGIPSQQPLSRSCADGSASGGAEFRGSTGFRSAYRLTVNLKNAAAFSASTTVINANNGQPVCIDGVIARDGDPHPSTFEEALCEVDLFISPLQFRLLAGDGVGF